MSFELVQVGPQIASVPDFDDLVLPSGHQQVSLFGVDAQTVDVTLLILADLAPLCNPTHPHIPYPQHSVIPNNPR